ncbi:MAG: 16S rRNA processing protein RimM [Desulfobulbaceae bacterium DB1]|nr:MAG: 16S rRNA processing protein RimM [Desulfobulbaceae bacterium DB1]
MSGEKTEASFDPLVLVGEIVKPHGIKGEVKVFCYSGQPGNFSSCKRILLETDDSAEKTSYGLGKIRSQGQFAVMALTGISSRDGAEALTGCKVWVTRDELPDLEDDEFYWQDLQGMEVITLQGQSLGRVANLLATGAHDILVIADRGKEYMIPAVDPFLVEIDHERHRIVVDAPDGLLEIND